MDFQTWLSDVDAYLKAQRLVRSELKWYNYDRAFQGGLTPAEASEEAIRNSLPESFIDLAGDENQIL